MTIIAAIAKNTNTNQLVIVGTAPTKSAASFHANNNTQDPWGNRRPHWSQIDFCEFESLADARGYIEAANRH